MFADRKDAGRRLAPALSSLAGTPGLVVLGVPRGGVVVAAEVARVLGSSLDVVAAAKVTAPGNPEYAIGAVAPDGMITYGAVRWYSEGEIADLADTVLERVRARLKALRGGRPEPELRGCVAVIVDDGIATGLTIRAAAEYARRQGASRVVVAAPVAAPDSAEMLRGVADQVVVLDAPPGFAAVGQYYRDFSQTADDEVMRLLVQERDPGEEGHHAE